MGILQFLRQRFVPSPKDIVASCLWLLMTSGGAALWAIHDAWSGPHIIALVIFVFASTLWAINQYNLAFRRRKTNEEFYLELRELFYKYGCPIVNNQNDNALFQFSTRLPSGKPLTIWRPKDAQSFIFIGVTISVGGIVLLDRMSRKESLLWISDLRLELARYGIDYQIDYRRVDLPINTIRLKVNFPITDNISEHEVLQRVATVEGATILCTELISRIAATDADEQPHDQTTV
jgi:hypothetical protein